MANQLFLETTALNTFVNEDSHVWVRAVDKYVRKRARDINVGDKVVVMNQFIDKDLEEMERYLIEESDEYRTARENIHEFNSEGEPIPILRTMLLRGLADEDTDDLEAKILFEDDDFSKGEYGEFVKSILDLGVTVGKGGVRYWLKEGRGFEDWGNFGRLADIDGRFADIEASQGQDQGYHFDYLWWKNPRAGIMSYISKIKDIVSGENKRKTTCRKSGKYSGIYERVVARLIDLVDEEKSVAMVRNIKKPRSQSQEQEFERLKRDPKLSRGIFNGDVAEEEQHKDYNYLIEAESILRQGIEDAVGKYFDAGGFDKVGDIEGLRPIILTHIKNELIKHNSMDKKYFMENLESNGFMEAIGKDNLMEILGGSYQHFKDSVRTGEADQKIGLPYGTMRTMIDTVNDYGSSFPKAVFSQRNIRINIHDIETKIGELYRNYGNKSDGKKPVSKKKRKRNGELTKSELTNQLGEEYKALVKKNDYLEKEYGILPGRKYFLHSMLYMLRNQGKLVMLKPSHGFASDYAKEYADKDISEWSDFLLIRYKKQIIDESGDILFKRQDVVDVLDKSGIPEAINVFNEKYFI